MLPAAPYAQLPEKLPIAVRETLRVIGIPEKSITQELKEMSAINVAKTNKGSVLGSMNQFRYEMDGLFLEIGSSGLKGDEFHRNTGAMV